MVSFHRSGLMEDFKKISTGILFNVFVLVRQQTYFSGTAGVAGIKFIFDDDARDETCADGHSHDRIKELCKTEFILSQGIAVYVIVDKYGKVKFFFKNAF